MNARRLMYETPQGIPPPGTDGDLGFAQTQEFPTQLLKVMDNVQETDKQMQRFNAIAQQLHNLQINPQLHSKIREQNKKFLLESRTTQRFIKVCRPIFSRVDGGYKLELFIHDGTHYRNKVIADNSYSHFHEKHSPKEQSLYEKKYLQQQPFEMQHRRKNFDVEGAQITQETKKIYPLKRRPIAGYFTNGQPIYRDNETVDITEIIIPQKVGGMDIAQFDNQLRFAHYQLFQQLTKLVILAPIKFLTKNIVSDLSQLDELVLSDALENISSRAFDNTRRLETFEVPSKIMCLHPNTFCENNYLRHLKLNKCKLLKPQHFYSRSMIKQIITLSGCENLEAICFDFQKILPGQFLCIKDIDVNKLVYGSFDQDPRTFPRFIDTRDDIIKHLGVLFVQHGGVCGQFLPNGLSNDNQKKQTLNQRRDILSQDFPWNDFLNNDRDEVFFE